MAQPKSPEAFRTISEVAEAVGVEQHVLRFWETKFPEIKPVKRAGGRRYYRRQDVDLLGGIRLLLRDDMMAIKGVQRILAEHGAAHVAALPGERGVAADGGPAPDEAAMSGGAVEAIPTATPPLPDAAPEAEIAEVVAARPAPEPRSQATAPLPGDLDLPPALTAPPFSALPPGLDPARARRWLAEARALRDRLAA